MIRTLPSLLGAAALALTMAATSATVALAEKVNLRFVVASDTDTMSENDGRGGLARLASVVKAERAKGGNVMFVFPGDLLSPSILAGFDKGKHMIDLLNIAPPDILVPGNHEYDFGPEVFIERMREGNFTKLATNTMMDGKPIPGFETQILKTYGDLKVGFIGITTDQTPVLSSPGNITFSNSVETATTATAELREKGADVVVAIVHTAQNIDFDLMYRAGADIVLSGHDHTLHVFFDGRRALVESKEEAEYVTVMDVAFDIGESRGRRRVRWWPNWQIIDTATVTPDPDVAAKVKAYEDTLSAELDVEIGVAEVELDSRRASVRGGETALGNLIADGMREAVDADVAITNGGGIRGDKEYAAGTELTRRDVLTELPFGNRTVSFELTGAQIKELLENGVSAVEDGAGRFPHVSGMTVEVDLSAEPGSRVTTVTVNGQPIDDAATYTVATNDYMGGGGDGYAAFEQGTPVIDAVTGDLMANDVMSFIREAGTISPAPEGRITLN